VKPRRLLLAVLRESLPWLIALLAADAVFILFIWLVDTQAFFILIGLMLLVSLVVTAAPVIYRFMRYRRVWLHLEAFSREPDETHETALTDLLPSFQRHLIHTLGERLRATRTELNAADVAITDYETWIEGWVHGIKTPLALMRLLLDNRADEMSPLVAQRLGHAHTTIVRDVENILFYARLGARHKDYLFEPLDLCDVCMTVVEASRASLEETGVTVEIEPSLGEAPPVTSDRSGLTFILGQLLSNSIKHAHVIRISAETIEAKRPASDDDHGAERPSVGGRQKTGRSPSGGGQAARQSASDGGHERRHETAASVALTFSDDGPGVSAADLPFIFDKGFTSASATREAPVASRHSGIDGTNTGMGLYLAQRMANDLVIEMTATSGQADGQATPRQCNGLTITLRFPIAYLSSDHKWANQDDIELHQSPDSNRR
jgi:signal transduction histidine kinase